MAVPNRPPPSPTTIVRMDVGVDSILLEIPNWRVRIKADDPASAVRNTNKTSCWDAPRSKRPKVSGKSASPTAEVSTETPGASSFKSSATSNPTSKSAPTSAATNWAAATGVITREIAEPVTC